MSYINLESYYRINFAAQQFQSWPISEIENFLPWERELYMGMLENHVEEERIKAQQS